MKPKTLLESPKMQMIASDMILLNFPSIPKSSGYKKQFLESPVKRLQRKYVICDHCTLHNKFNQDCGYCQTQRIIIMRFLP